MTQSMHDQLLEKAKNSPLSYFIRNVHIVFLIVFGLLIWGGSSFLSIPKEDAPTIDFGMVSIVTIFDGATAYDMDSLVTQEMETKLKDVDGVKKITSSSQTSVSSVTVEFYPGVDMTKAVSDVRSKVDEVKPKLPSGAEDPTITEINSSNRPLFDVVLYGEYHPVYLRDIAEQLKRNLETSSAVRDVTISGGKERMIYFDFKPEALDQYGLTLSDVIQSVSMANRDYPLGQYTIDDFKYAFRIEGKMRTAEAFSETVIMTLDGSPVFLSDVARVYEQSDDSEFVQHIWHPGDEKVTEMVLLAVKKSANSNIFQIDPAIREQVAVFMEKYPDIHFEFINASLEDVEISYSNVYTSAFSSFVIVIFFLIIFIGWKEAIAASLIVPLSYLVTVGVTNAQGESLNFMVNFAMVLSIGILVDTAIVIVEGIHYYLKNGYSPEEAAMMSVEEFKFPLLSGTLTTLAVFIPLFSLPDILGKYLSYIPRSVTITLTASLTIALLLIPAMAARIIAFFDERGWNFKIHVPILDNLESKYDRLIRKLMGNDRFRTYGVYGVVFLCFLSFFLPVKFELFPSDDFPLVNVAVEMSEGATTEQTAIAMGQVENQLRELEMPEVRYMVSSYSGNSGSIAIHLYQKEVRDEKNQRTSIEISDELRVLFKQYKNFDVSVQELQNGPPGDSPVGIRIILSDASLMNQALQVSQDFIAMLESIPGTDNVRDDIVNLPGEITFTIDREKVLRYGVDVNVLTTTIRAAVDNTKVLTFTRDGLEVDVIAQFAAGSINTFDDIRLLQVKNRQGDLISVDELINYEIRPSLSEIKRTDRNIAIRVSSDVAGSGNALEITDAFMKEVDAYVLPDGISIENAGETAENAALFQALLFGAIMGVFMIFAILVVQFESYVQPFIIIFTILMSFIGVNFGLFITDTPRSLAMIIGVISLGGIVVNDAIVFVDRINNLRAAHPNDPIIDIVAQAGVSRLQPIILTTLTTISGIAPLIFVDTFWAGLSFTVIFGLFVATTLTLFITPQMYIEFELNLKKTVMRPLKIIGVFILVGVLFGVVSSMFS